MIIGGIIPGTNLGNLQINANSESSQQPNTTQANSIIFESPITMSEVTDYFQDKTRFNNLKSTSVITELQTANHTIPLPIELDLTNPDTIISNFNQKYKQTTTELAKSIRESKTNSKTTNQPKYTREQILKSFKISSKPTPSVAPSAPNPAPGSQLTPEPATITEEELSYLQQHGTLPLKQVNEQEVRAKIKELGMPDNQPIPHLDPKLRGKLIGATEQERLASMNDQDKQQHNQRQQEQLIQQEIIAQITEQELLIIEKSTELQSKVPQIISIQYMTSVGDQSAKKLAKQLQKPIITNLDQITQAEQTKLSKPSIKSQSKPNPTKNTTQSPKLQDNIKSIISQDITSMFQVTDQEKQTSKAKQQRELEDYKSRAKQAKEQGKSQQHSQLEAEMYKKEGIDVEELGGQIYDDKGNNLTEQKSQKNNQEKTKKTSNPSNPNSTGIDITSLVNSTLNNSLANIGSIDADAKGLNNAKNSLVLYNAIANNMAITADSYTNWQQLRIRQNYGSYSAQRWCFDNDHNKIYMTNEGTCSTWWNKKCLHALGGNNYGGSVGLYDCNFQNGTDSNQTWIFDEQGRIVLKWDQNYCVDNYSSNNEGGAMVTWGCYGGATQQYRAGYSNFGTGMGMTIWSTPVGNESAQNFNGHTYIELWTSYGIHNTFGKWSTSDNDCSGTGRVNNICDYDAVSVDRNWEVEHYFNPVMNGTNYYKKGTWSGLSKTDWDYIVFGSGYRSNFKPNNNYINLGGTGTYDWWGYSKSRDSNYYSQYNFYTGQYCSTYALNFWWGYRDSGSTTNLNNLNWWGVNPYDVYNAI